MREIKFRAWDGKRFWYFDLTDWRLDAGTLYPHDEPGEPSVDLSQTENQQYTGLHDKNGKEIYEGDVVTGDYGKFYCVGWTGIYDDNGTTYPGWSVGVDERTGKVEVEIIGNIYENPELLP